MESRKSQQGEIFLTIFSSANGRSWPNYLENNVDLRFLLWISPGLPAVGPFYRGGSTATSKPISGASLRRLESCHSARALESQSSWAFNSLDLDRFSGK